MTTQNTKSATNDIKSATDGIQSMFNPQGYQNVFKTWASMNERMIAIVVEAGNRSIDIMSDTTKETLSNLREATQVRDAPAEYGKAYSAFAQKQMNLLQRSAQDVGDVTQKAGTETTELASKADAKSSDKVDANVKDTADKAGSADKKASKADEKSSDKVAANAKDTADKAGSADKKASKADEKSSDMVATKSSDKADAKSSDKVATKSSDKVDANAKDTADKAGSADNKAS